MKKIIYMILATLIFIPSIVFADGSVTVSPTFLEMEVGGSKTFTITFYNTIGDVTIKSSDTAIATVNTSSWETGMVEEKQTKKTTITVKAIAPGNATITVKIDGATFDGEDLSGQTRQINIKVNAPKSSNNNLQSLSVDGKTVSGFSSSKTSYDLGEISSNSINITGSPEDSKAKISGTGSKTLNYGKNTFNVVVTAENGSKKTYTITVTKPDPRSKDNALSSLTIKELDLKFNKNTTSYSFKVEHSVKNITINAKANDSKASVSGTGTKTLKDYVNTFNIIVTAENGSKKTYTIKVIRKDSEGNLGSVSKDNTLKKLTVENYQINFNKDTLEYSIEVDNLIDSIKVNAETNDKTATYEIVGNTNLSVGTNAVKINITAENGDIKTYIINVTRKSDSPSTTIKDLETVLNKASSNEIIVEIKDDNTLLNKETLNLMNNSKKEFTINNYLNNMIIYTWNINGKNINNINEIDTNIKFSSDNQESIDKLTNYADSIYLNFQHNGELPKDTHIKIYVGNKYQNNDKVNVYYYNQDKSTMDTIKLDVEVIDGYVEFEIEHCSEYIITKSILNNKTSFNISTYIAIAEFILIVGYITYIVFNKKLKKN